MCVSPCSDSLFPSVSAAQTASSPSSSSCCCSSTRREIFNSWKPPSEETRNSRVKLTSLQHTRKWWEFAIKINVPSLTGRRINIIIIIIIVVLVVVILHFDEVQLIALSYYNLHMHSVDKYILTGTSKI